MLFKTFLFLVGYALIVISLTLMILYTNLFTIGYNFLEFVQYINRRFVIVYFIVGLILTIYSINYKGDR